ncbi:MAG TPA: hypothetical protein VJM31_06110 [Vicinamibacterales bacterium]|nr:hypothetical protein [Vicinamibacterales bacterium]
MTKYFCVAVISAWLVTGCAPSARTQTQQMPKGTNTNPDAKQIADFLARVEAYNKLRNDLAKDTPKLKETVDPSAIGAAEKSLATSIRAARANAKRGDIFTPATEAMFRRLVRPQVTGTKDAADNTAIIKDDAPKPGEVPFKVNGEYPKDAPLSTVPPDVLKALPPLPENLQYRFAGRHLILYCMPANLIVDYMLNALP